MVGSQPYEFDRTAGLAAVLAGVAAFAYAVAFLFVSRAAPELGDLLSALCLMLNGILATLAVVALYERLGQRGRGLALWALLLSAAGALGAAIHGGYDLANAIHPPDSNPLSAANLPSQIDPRGLLTFGLAGLGLAGFAWLMARGEAPRGLPVLGFLSAALLVLLYLGRLIALNPSSPVILAPAALNGLLIGPAWYIWLGLWLRRAQPAVSDADGAAEQVTAPARRA